MSYRLSFSESISDILLKSGYLLQCGFVLRGSECHRERVPGGGVTWHRMGGDDAKGYLTQNPNESSNHAPPSGEILSPIRLNPHPSPHITHPHPESKRIKQPCTALRRNIIADEVEPSPKINTSHPHPTEGHPDVHLVGYYLNTNTILPSKYLSRNIRHQ